MAGKLMELRCGGWAIKTVWYPYACEVLSPFPLCLWPFYFISLGHSLAELSHWRPKLLEGREHRIGEEGWKLFACFYRLLFHHGSQEQEFSLGYEIQGLPSILGWYVRLLSVLSGSCHCLSFFFFF